MALPRKRTIGRRKGTEELKLYDYTDDRKTTLRYVRRPKSIPDPGVVLLGTRRGAEGDNLCKLWHAELLTGEALKDAEQVCGPKPDDFVFPDRFVKSYEEMEQNKETDYP